MQVYEASDGVGGRVRTDQVDGFTLDRGFQVALTAYPEMHRQLDMAALDLQAFDPGALVWRNGKGSVVSDPFRRPTTALSTVVAPIGSPFDKARIALLRHRLRGVHPARLLRGDDISTRAALADAGFSDTIIERFFRPLVGGIQLDPDLTDSRRMFDVIFRMLADGDSAVPAAGMQAIPEQLADRLPDGTVHLGCAGDGRPHRRRSPSAMPTRSLRRPSSSRPRDRSPRACSASRRSSRSRSARSTSRAAKRRSTTSWSSSTARAGARC